MNNAMSRDEMDSLGNMIDYIQTILNGMEVFFEQSKAQMEKEKITPRGMEFLQSTIRRNAELVGHHPTVFATEGLEEEEIQQAAEFALEGFKEVISKAWKKLTTLILALVKKYNEFSAARTRDLEVVIAYCEATEKWLKKNNAVSPSLKELELGETMATKMTYKGKLDPQGGIKSISKIMSAKTVEKEVHREMKNILGKYKTRSVKTVEEAKKSFGSAAELMNADAESYISNLKRLGFSDLKDSRFNADKTIYLSTDNLPGDEMIVAAIQTLEVAGTEQKEIFSIKFNFYPVDPNQKFDNEAEAMEARDLIKLCSTVRSAANQMRDYKGGIKDANKMVDAYLKEGDRLTKELMSLSDADRKALGETYNKAKVLTGNILKISKFLFEPQQTIDARLIPLMNQYLAYIKLQRSNLKTK